ncbi:hypothetical protein DBR11_10150 [Pedobacter sp. HMWF019]|uniref:sensor histidine kinase n=1 Tax=Pedobacter sp. HMWF019 TaxID=2056856 RepID=UPI000D3C6176|nr:sensor histidine kinase [Pedobacter sp. HMWF019]PTT00342.1 hypothetical protein DBR11_10150 [Pedobacter sp. HMWF019]
MNASVILDQIYKNRKHHILAHVMFWLCFLFLRWYLTTISFNVFRVLPRQSILWLNLASVACLVIFYYTLVYLIMPFYLKKKKLIPTLFAILFVFTTYTILDTYLETHILSACSTCKQIMQKYNADYYEFLHLDFSNIIFKKVLSLGVLIGLLFNVSVPLGIRYAIKTFKQNIMALKMSRDNIQLEYNFLKAQINPHFLFNTLNNIYGLVLQDNKEKSAALIAKLSEFMRYTLYEADQEKMPIQREIELIEDYIELEKVRLNFTKTDLQVHMDKLIFFVPPLLFIPIVENAFKFCPDQIGALIEINFQLGEKQLVFKCTNSIAEINTFDQSEGGIGLQNLKKRLELYFPNKHQYIVVVTATQYVTTLILEL